MRPLVATVDLSAIRHNYARARACAPGRRVFAVVKANAYGHGVREVVSALPEADGFVVACLEEAGEVRGLHGKARVLLLQGCFEPREYQMAAQLGLDVVVQSREQAEMLLGVQPSRPLSVWLKLDSGMHRLGFSAVELREWHARLGAAEQVGELNLLSHFACADLPGHPLNRAQLDSFRGLDDLPFASRSLANSAAILTRAEAHFDWLRPGIMLYGASPFAERPAAEFDLRPAMTLSGALIAVREVAAGESVGYGASWVAERPARIGTLSCGYADGYPRCAPAGTPVLVGGRRVPLVGRVSMDLLTVDLSAVPEAQVGTPVELWGAQLPVDEVAAACGTIGYELLGKVAARVARRHHY
ncbi:alanine racemase [Pseudomonas stutzeri]|nr:alanine racemase [Stutzerimonas stutzeri]